MDQADESRARFRPMRRADAGPLRKAFQAMGWTRPEELFLRYVAEHDAGDRWVLMAERAGEPAGYVTVRWAAEDPVLRAAGLPEILDLSVLDGHRRRGLGRALLERAEARVARDHPVVGLRVGLHSGYGRAQRLYARTGYLPDGRGAQLRGETVPEGARIHLDDDVTLRLTKRLR